MSIHINSTKNTASYQWGRNCQGWKLLENEQLAFIEERMPSGASENWHYHQHSQQVFYLLSGLLEFEVEDENHAVSSFQSIAIPPQTLHRVKNISGEEAKFLVISAPATKNDRINIIDYDSKYENAFCVLNEEWLDRYFVVEEWDRLVLSNPQEQILSKGGTIYYAVENGNAVGTVALMPDEKGDVELTKMAVTEAAQGKGIGQQLLKHALREATKMGLEKLFLFSNRRLASAIHLYRKLGFQEIPLGDIPYKRANIKMEILLKNKLAISQ